MENRLFVFLFLLLYIQKSTAGFRRFLCKVRLLIVVFVNLPVGTYYLCLGNEGVVYWGHIPLLGILVFLQRRNMLSAGFRLRIGCH